MSVWKKKLTKDMRKHLTQIGITTLRGLKNAIEVNSRAGVLDKCWTCVEIKRRLGL